MRSDLLWVFISFWSCEIVSVENLAPISKSCPFPHFHQEPKTDKDDEYCRKVNEYLNNPPIPGAPGSGGGSGHELSALGGEGGLQNLLGNMSHNQLMQLMGPTGLGGLGEQDWIFPVTHTHSRQLRSKQQPKPDCMLKCQCSFTKFWTNSSFTVADFHFGLFSPHFTNNVTVTK